MLRLVGESDVVDRHGAVGFGIEYDRATMKRTWRFCIVAGALWMVCTAAQAAEPTRHERAVKLFEDSAAVYREGQFGRAVELLLAAYELEPAPVLLYNLGRVYEGMGEQAKAADAYERYLRDDPTAKDRGALEEKIQTLRRHVEERKALQRSRAPRVIVTPPHKPSVLPWIVLSAGAVAAGAGMALGFSAKQLHEDAVADPVQQSAVDKQDRAQSMALWSDISIVGGGVMALVGGVWAFLDLRKASSGAPKMALQVGARHMGIAGEF